MTREDDLKSLFSGSTLVMVTPLIEELVYIESQIESLRKEPMIRYHPSDRSIQKMTPAARLYKDLVAKETDIVRTLTTILRRSESDGDVSPLRAYLERMK